MATLTRSGDDLEHKTSTITFDGGSGSGAVGTVDVFTLTGRVLVESIMAFCTTLLTEGGATATIELGDTTDINGFIAQTNAVNLDANEWWGNATPVAGSVKLPNVGESGGAGTAQRYKALSTDIKITVATQSVDTGVVVFDVWYRPATSNGALVAS